MEVVSYFISMDSIPFPPFSIHFPITKPFEVRDAGTVSGGIGWLDG